MCKNLEVLVFYYTMTREQTKIFESRFSSWAKELRNIDALDSLKDFINIKSVQKYKTRKLVLTRHLKRYGNLI